jgi:predicted O-methyltransferase YrrM
MTQQLWTEVDQYLTDRLVPSDEALESALQNSADAGLPEISVAPNQGKLLHLFALASGAERVLEIGTLGGYRTIWLGRALPPRGRLVTLEADAHHAEVARANIARAGLADRVEMIVGPALETLPELVERRLPPFDLTFIDADKAPTAEYFAWSLRLSHVGSLIIVDNVVRQGGVADAASDEPSVVGMRRLFDALADEPRVTATAVQTVGSKGHDGFVLALVTGEVD